MTGCTDPRVLMVTSAPGARFVGAAGFTAPVAHAGLLAPNPVPKRDTTDPGPAGWSGPLIVPSWLMAAACVETPGRRKKKAGAAAVTVTANGPNSLPL